jgi:hypothetical protein
MCPRGCSNKKIKFSGTCRVCHEKFMYFVLDKRIRTNEDLFDTDDEPELWTCKKCNNHNIDVKMKCSKCNRNKDTHNEEEKE